MKRVLNICIIALILFPVGIKAQQVHSWWVTNGITMDGNPMEWPQPFRYYDGATKLQFSIANDTANIYVCLKLTDEQAESRIFKTGLNIWIDPKGKKKEAIGIVFPIRSGRNPSEGQSHTYAGDELDPRVQHNNVTRLKQHVFMDQTTLRIKGFIGAPEQTLPLKNSYGIDVAFNWDSLDILTLEYKIPVKLVLGHNLNAGDTLKPVGIGFVEGTPEERKAGEGKDDGIENGGLVNNNSSMNRGSMNNGMSNGMGGAGSRGGMGGGGGRGMGGGSYSQAPQEQKVWSKVIMAYQ